MRCVLGTGLQGLEDTIPALQGPQSAGEQASGKGRKAEVEGTGRVGAGPAARVTPSAWVSLDDGPALGA